MARLRSALPMAAVCLAALLLPWPHPRIFASVDGASACGEVSWWDLPHDLLAYAYALHLERSWSPAAPRSRQELERHLSLYSVREIAPRESCWGSDWTLAPGQRMVQYSILWHAPLDVVYDSSDRIQALYTSYE